MKIFISYGHDDHTELVDRLFDALLAAGHTPWKDDRYEGCSGIPAGEDFTQVIYDAIDDSDFVVAFVTQVTQNKPYCKDERQYAYNKKGTHFIQIRMDNETIRLGNAGSYIDMTDVETFTGALDLALLDKKLEALYAAFRDPESFSAGNTHWAKFETHLKVQGAVKYEDIVGYKGQETFVGRQWLREACRDWAMDSSNPCRLFVILGAAGTGKTAFIRNLATDGELVRSVHVCVYDRRSTRSVQDTLKDLAYILAQNNETYFDFLKSKNLEGIRDMNEDALFEFLFLEPLKNEKKKYLLIIDGLDELDEISGFKPLMQLFRQYAYQINPNVSFLVTGRPDENILTQLRMIGKGKPVTQVVLDTKTSREDLTLYIHERLQQLGQYTPSLAKKILDACDGNFEYLSLLFKEAAEEGLVLSDDIPLPRGLNDRYTQYLDRRMDACRQDNHRLTREQRMLLSVLCVAQEPMPLSLLSDILGEDPFDVEDYLSVFGSLIRQGDHAADPLVALFTKSFRDYLLSKTHIPYSTDQERGTAQIVNYITTHCDTPDDFSKIPYFARNGFVHLLTYGQRDADTISAYLEKLINSDEKNTDLMLADALVQGGKDAIATYCQLQDKLDRKREVVQHLRSRRAKAALTEIMENYRRLGRSFSAQLLECDILRMDPTEQNQQRIEQIYRNALAIMEANYAKKPDIGTRRDLNIVYDGLGQSCRSKQTQDSLDQAKVWYEKALALSQENYDQKPDFVNTRDLIVSQDRLALLAQQRNTPAGWEEAEQRMLIIARLCEENYEKNPCSRSRRDVAVTYARMGSIHQQKHTPQSQAQYTACLEKTYELYLQANQENPCFNTNLDLASILRRLSSAYQQTNTPQSMTKAEQCLQQALELDTENYRETPCYDSRKNLSLDYKRFGQLENSKQEPGFWERALEWFRKALELNTESYNVYPCYATRESLGSSHIDVGDLYRNLNSPEGKDVAQQEYEHALKYYQENYDQHANHISRQTPEAGRAQRPRPSHGIRRHWRWFWRITKKTATMQTAGIWPILTTKSLCPMRSKTPTGADKPLRKCTKKRWSCGSRTTPKNPPIRPAGIFPSPAAHWAGC